MRPATAEKEAELREQLRLLKEMREANVVGAIAQHVEHRTIRVIRLLQRDVLSDYDVHRRSLCTIEGPTHPDVFWVDEQIKQLEADVQAGLLIDDDSSMRTT